MKHIPNPKCFISLLLSSVLLPCYPLLAQDTLIYKDEFIRRLSNQETVAPNPNSLDGLDFRAPGGTRPRSNPEVSMSIHFQYDSVELADEFSHLQLYEARDALASDALRFYQFEIGGHTDNKGTDAYNLKLSLRRAEAIRKILCYNKQIDCYNLKVKGYGEAVSIDTTNTEAGLAKNRRVVIKRLN